MTADIDTDNAYYLYKKMSQSLEVDFGDGYTDTERTCLDYIDICGSSNFYNIMTNKWSLLSFACYIGYIKLALKLMHHGADINQTCEDGWSPLMCSVSNSTSNLQIRHNIVKELIRRGVDVNYKSITPSSTGFSALSVACSHRNKSMAITLIRAGAKFDDIMYSHIHGNNLPEIEQCIKDIYHEQIIAVINAERTDETGDNAMAISFRTTYAVELVGIIAEFII
ncbi:MAG: hypothetical protein Faunusvirus2_23 [Faunusvirus sp.]|jgi:ankyrin repeat protein|uniref:Uncharacterized protein n=1 Tax=Faunusvirus sp. TaxID=2487766 RepID=A0A3G4ZW13_9VIRU|nr:MAG: hypothetical protein Faunusvirus2_23 [Faunusvirus sp.]